MSLLHLSNFPFPARLMYNLGDGENWGAIAVNLLPLLAKEVQHRGEQQSQRSKAHRQVYCTVHSAAYTIVLIPNRAHRHGAFYVTFHTGESPLSACPPFSAC